MDPHIHDLWLYISIPLLGAIGQGARILYSLCKTNDKFDKRLAIMHVLVAAVVAYVVHAILHLGIIDQFVPESWGDAAQKIAESVEITALTAGYFAMQILGFVEGKLFSFSKKKKEEKTVVSTNDIVTEDGHRLASTRDVKEMQELVKRLMHGKGTDSKPKDQSE